MGGAVGVCTFLILSGYGLTESYKKKGITVKFIFRRITTVFIPFWIVMIGEGIIDYFFLGKILKTKDLLLSIIGYVNYNNPCIDPTMWYITFLALNYFLFMFVFSFKIKDKWKVCIFLCLNIVGYISQFFITADWKINYFSFSIGIILSYYQEFFKRINLTILNNIALSIFIISTLISTQMSSVDIWSIYGYSGAIWLITLMCSVAYRFKILAWLGKVSYMIYLVEGAILFKYGIIYLSNSLGRNIVSFICYSIILGTIIWLVAYRFLPKLYKNREKKDF